MIYIVEIPHQHKPMAWCAADNNAVIDAINATFTRSGESFDTLESALEYNAADLSKQLVYMSYTAALNAVNNSTDFNCHGGAAAEDALRHLLKN